MLPRVGIEDYLELAIHALSDVCLKVVCGRTLVFHAFGETFILKQFAREIRSVIRDELGRKAKPRKHILETSPYVLGIDDM